MHSAPLDSVLASQGKRSGASVPDGEMTVKLRLLASGATPRMGGYIPQRIDLRAEQPPGLHRTPELAAPLFGVFSLGPRESPSRVIVAVDEPEGRPARLYVDSNGNGDLTDDPAFVWEPRTTKSPDGKELTMYQGVASVELALGGKPVPAHLGLYRFDKNDPLRIAVKNALLYYADYAYEGEITLGAETYRAMLVDRLATGDFRGADGPDGSGVVLMIDANRSGRFESGDEIHDVRKPFKIKGTTYEITGLSASGAEFQIRQLDQAVVEILPPPDLSPGQKAIKFSARTTAGQEKKGLLKSDQAEFKTEPLRINTSVTTLLNDLRRAGNAELANELSGEIEQAQAEVARYQKMSPPRPAHVIVGRVVGEGLHDASRVLAPMPIHREDYFVGPVGTSGRPIGFRMQGYLPVEITPTGEPGSVENVGEVRLKPLPEAMRAGVKGTLVLDGATSASKATSRLTMTPGTLNTPSGALRLGFSITENVAVASTGEFSASGLSPTGYAISFEAPGSVSQNRFMTLKPGETLDLGTIRLEQSRWITVSYREAPSPPFSQAAAERQEVLGGGQFKAGNPRFGYDLRFDQEKQEIIRFGVGYGPCRIADLGPGKLDDFLEADPTSARLVYPTSLVPRPGHVYLLDQKSLSHWVLFQFALDPDAPQ